MKTIKLLTALLLLVTCPLQAQDIVTITGKVVDKSNSRELGAVSVVADNGHTATVTNANGVFEIKVPRETRQLNFSHLGYASRHVDVPKDGKPLRVALSPTAIMLDEILVADPEDILRLAIKNIPDNYAAAPVSQRCFYRETTQKGRRFIYVAEAINDMYKEAYSKGIFKDHVSIPKARRLVSTQVSDTLGAKIVGGPVTPITLDIMKNLDFMLSNDRLGLYNYTLKPAAGQGKVVVSMEPKDIIVQEALLYGDFYIDTRTMAVTHIDLKLDLRREVAATAYMLRHKPAGVRFKPRGLEIHVNYKPDPTGRLSLSYIRSEISFKCEWKRKLFASPYKVTSEMVVTDEQAIKTIPRKGKDFFRERETLYDHPEYFGDPDFWEQYNIIPPTHTLEKGIKAFIKKNYRK